MAIGFKLVSGVACILPPILSAVSVGEISRSDVRKHAEPKGFLCEDRIATVANQSEIILSTLVLKQYGDGGHSYGGKSASDNTE